MNVLKLEEAFRKCFDLLNQNWRMDPDMKDTPARVARMYAHFFRNEGIEQHYNKKFPTTNRQLVILKNIECFGMCPHHLTPIVYIVHIGYVPMGLAIGLSKLVRIAMALSSYPKLQENFTSELAESINNNLKPQGVIVIIEGLHNCIRCRGVENNSICITSEIKGIFMENPNIKIEFMDLLNIHQTK